MACNHTSLFIPATNLGIRNCVATSHRICELPRTKESFGVEAAFTMRRRIAVLCPYTLRRRCRRQKLILPPTRIPLSGIGTTCFTSCCDKDSAIIFTTSRLPDVNPP
jgi:hypothetical protein